MLRIALAQINSTIGDFSGNREKIISFVKKAVQSQADVVVFPELAVCGYPPEDLLYKKQFINDNLKSTRFLAKKISKITAVVGFVDMDKKGNIFNAAAVIAQGQIKGVYHKHDLPNYGVFDEKRYFKEGKENPLFNLGGILTGITICEDIWNSSGIHVQQAKLGAKVLINISASPYDFSKFEQRQKMLMSRARNNKAFVCYANLVGGQDELVFDGGSLIIDPFGKIVASGKQFEEDLIIADLPVKENKSTKGKAVTVNSNLNKHKKPITVSTAKPLTQIERAYKALVLGTRDYIHKNGFKKVVLGLSGGIDSSLVAVIAREAVGKENVIGISMPSQYNSKETISDARRLAEKLGIRFIEIPIEGVFATFLFIFRKEFAGQKSGLAEENLQARIRGTMLMTFSNKFGWLVLTTGNKSEFAVGYCTLYGDMSGGFAVIKDLPKTQVYAIAGFINNKIGKLIPESVFKRAPTAELRSNQKDEDSLPPYATLDPILKGYVEEHQSLQSLAKKVKNARLVKEIINMVDKSEYKRRQAPPGVKITTRAFGKDWRLPITNKYKEF